MSTVFGIILPYLAIVIFILGMAYRIYKWGKSAVPFRIPTTCGQQKSLPWLETRKLGKPSNFVGAITNRLDNPSNMIWVTGRMVMEVLLFRSLWRNSTAEVKPGAQKLLYGGNKFLWFMGLVFHWSLLIILVRHLRLLIEPVPWIIKWLGDLDGVLEIMVPTIFITDLLILLALTYLFLRRVAFPQLRYISLLSDYFALLLIIGVALSGIIMRLFFKVDVVAVKELAMSVLRFDPVVPDGIGWWFWIHLVLVCSLLAYFPFSKMVHLGGIFFSPTRNMANTNRVKRHVNPWDYPVKVHPYDEYEEEFREKMRKVGLPLEKE